MDDSFWDSLQVIAGVQEFLGGPDWRLREDVERDYFDSVSCGDLLNASRYQRQLNKLDQVH